MRSFSPRALSLAWTLVAALIAGVVFPARASAEQQVRGFAVERLYPSAPGGGWFVMDDLAVHGGLGGVMAVSTGYAHNPLRIASTDGSQHLNLVSDQAFADFGFAATYDRWRFYLNVTTPLVVDGQRGTVGGYQLTAPEVALDSNPDTLTDARVGVDARILGEAKSAFRLGAGAQLLVPSANEDRSQYVTDGTPRAMGRVLFAGDVGAFTYAGHLGVHVRPLDDSPAPASPRGSELLFGIAGGARVPISGSAATVLVVGPEVYGASAFRSLLSTNATALEGLLTTRLEGTANDRAQLRVKLGAGAGIDDHFGAPEWRLVFGVELFDYGSP
jgi:hypothetical protein